MTLKERIMEDVKVAMKSGDSARLGVLRMMMAAIRNREIEMRTEKSTEVSDADVIAVLEKEAKKRREASDLYKKGARADLAKNELYEVEVIAGYLPPQLNDEEIMMVIEKCKVAGANDFASLMRDAMKEMKGKADGRRVGELVKQSLG
ncbi:MAG: GatB/YqeY domain-containing protein [Patescibacteria group bacterium]|nr:GatB/YqeY domain-containing protein [Patescibacteria group bacterium]